MRPKFAVSRILSISTAAALLVACAPSPHLRVTGAITRLGISMDKRMLEANLTAMVGFDESFSGTYNRSSRAALYMASVIEGTPEYQYRVVRLNMGLLDGALWHRPGSMLYSTAAMVPDQIPRLMAGDVVELRHAATDRSLENFSVTGEGNIVVRVLCFKAQPDYMDCMDKLPKTGSSIATGRTETPYPVSVKAYGFTFTPAYDKGGKVLRPLPKPQNWISTP